MVNEDPNRDIDQLLPWAYRNQALKAVAENDAYAKLNIAERRSAFAILLQSLRL
jgi:hypothetical protein